jgi:hypothetical protein
VPKRQHLASNAEELNKRHWPKEFKITIDSFEHAEHRFMVIVIKEPDAWIFVFLFKGHC